MTRPVIGTTVSRHSGWRIYPVLRATLWLAGARTVRWDSRRDADIDAVDALLVGGGDNISAEFYGGEIMPKSRLDPERDALERRLVIEAFEAGKPVLGICRGAQMINVALGGDLHQDAYGFHGAGDAPWTMLPRKTVHLEPASRLAEVTGPENMRVNALHSQAVAGLGEGLRVAARDEHGMVQAVERLSDPFVLGVQWHPEYLFYARRQRRIFRALIAAASACRDHAPQTEAVDEMPA